MATVPVPVPVGCNLTSHKGSGDSYPVAYPCPFCKVHSRMGASDRYVTPTTCFESRDTSLTDDLQTATLYAEGMAKIVHDVYPQEIHDVSSAILPYDEPLHPIPVGASVFYLIMIAWVTTFYFTYLGRKILAGVKQKLDLHPEVEKFPSLPLYWIQQSTREAELRREVRNTWAWLARRYLLSPNDPLLDNVDQVLGLVNWHDFEVSRTTWSLVRIILTVNSLYVKVKRNRKERTKHIEIVKDDSLAKRNKLDNDSVHTTRIIIENAEGDEDYYPSPKPDDLPNAQQPGASKELEKKNNTAKGPQKLGGLDSDFAPVGRMGEGESGRIESSDQSHKSILQKSKLPTGQLNKSRKPPPKSKPKITKPASLMKTDKPKKPPLPRPPSPSNVRFSKKGSQKKKTVHIGGTTTAGESTEDTSTDFDTRRQLQYPDFDTDTVDTTGGVGGSSVGGLTTEQTTTSADIGETSAPAKEYSFSTDWTTDDFEGEFAASPTTTAADVQDTSSTMEAATKKKRRRRKKRKDKGEWEDETRKKKKKTKNKELKMWRYFYK